MIPLKRKKLGQKVTILCPDCDGQKINLAQPEFKCPTCEGKGKIEGTVTTQ